MSDELWQSPEQWAGRIFGRAQVGDARLRRRVCAVAAALAAHPRDTIPQAMGSWAAAKAAYRLMGNERVGPQALLASVAGSTLFACAGLTEVVCVHDTTSLSFPWDCQIEGLGRVGNRNTPGLHVHTVLAVTGEGQVVGVLGQQVWARPRGVSTRRLPDAERPRSARESAKWRRGIDQARAVFQNASPQPRLIHVFDREGDINDALAAVIEGGDGAVVRSLHERRVRTGQKQILSAHALIAQAPVMARTTIEIARRPDRKPRTAQIEVRAMAMHLSPHHWKGTRPLELNMIEVREVNAPAKTTALVWRLWTSEPASTADEAMRVVALYRLRWKIEEIHLVLKSGCRVEDLRLSSAAKIKKALALYTPVAARVVALRDLGRLSPEAPCTAVLSEIEWRVLSTRIQGKPPPRSAQPPTMRQAIAWIGRLGGHLGRKGDGAPGVRTLWRGLRDLQLLTELFEVLQGPAP